MTLFNLYATGPGTPTGPGSTGDYTDHLFLGYHHAQTLAMDALLLADQRRTCFHDGRGWYEAPETLAHELWARELTGRPIRVVAHVVARIAGDTLTVASEFAVTLPGGEPTGALAAFDERYRLITNRSPNRTSRLRHVITPGGRLPAKGA
ncbi:hypothetical protein AB0M39_38080 [Streptomyces sp. NPDC051907]|uniref:hypothetical protein n=1 Tax=Streptomyces sp. NPDC051907 TaxID=3155284 RepID=UPI00343004E5